MKASKLERLALLIEETGEVNHVGCKILRHGYNAYHPEYLMNNRRMLEEEIGDMLAAVAILVNAGDISLQRIELARSKKMEKVQEYMHHQPAKVFVLERKSPVRRHG